MIRSTVCKLPCYSQRSYWRCITTTPARSKVRTMLLTRTDSRDLRCHRLPCPTFLVGARNPDDAVGREIDDESTLAGADVTTTRLRRPHWCTIRGRRMRLHHTNVHRSEGCHYLPRSLPRTAGRPRHVCIGGHILRLGVSTEGPHICHLVQMPDRLHRLG